MNDITLQRLRQANDYWGPRLFIWSYPIGLTWWMLRPSTLVFVMGAFVVPVIVIVTSHLVDVILSTMEDELEFRRFRSDLDEWGTR